MTAGVIRFPDFEKLKTEVDKLRAELQMLVLELDELLYVECKNIEMTYLLAFGSLEYKAYEIQCAILRLKRKIEIIQAKKNRQEQIVLSLIEETLDSEFEEYQLRLNEQIEKMNAAIAYDKAEFLSEQDAHELKQLYRIVVKELHPDLHPDLSAAMMQLFQNAVAAYENGDLNSLRTIKELVANPALPPQNEAGMVQLAKEKERLSGLLRAVREKIVEIKSTYPYNMKTLLQTPERMAAKKTETEGMIEELNEILSIYQCKIKKMLR